KRKETEDNLERIRIILDEIDKQIKQLEADRDGALKYRDLNEKLTTAKAQLAYKNRELIERQIVGTKEQIAKHEGDKAKLEAQKEELRGRLDAAVARLNELEQEMADRGGDEAKQLKEKLDGLRIERARATDGIETSKATARRRRWRASSRRSDCSRNPASNMRSSTTTPNGSLRNSSRLRRNRGRASRNSRRTSTASGRRRAGSRKSRRTSRPRSSA